MKIVLINGSPKVKKSASSVLLEDLKIQLCEKAQIVEAAFHTSTVSEETLEELRNADAWVFAYPLYVDGIPAHLLSCLVQLEEAHLKDRKIHIYGIVNCGFYEGIQAEPALEILQNWCVKAEFIWGGGLGVGGGGALSSMSGLGPTDGPKAPIGNRLLEIAEAILLREGQENRCVSFGCPRWMYKMIAQMGWRRTIKANGGRTKDLGKQA